MNVRSLFTAERLLQYFSVALSIFLIVYLLTYVSNARERSDCQTAVNSALITSVTAGRDANAIEAKAMDDLLSGLLAPGDHNTRELLEIYQEQRNEATSLRVNNPLPDPHCE